MTKPDELAMHRTPSRARRTRAPVDHRGMPRLLRVTVTAKLHQPDTETLGTSMMHIRTHHPHRASDCVAAVPRELPHSPAS